jgi:hypothetical protein
MSSKFGCWGGTDLEGREGALEVHQAEEHLAALRADLERPPAGLQHTDANSSLSQGRTMWGYGYVSPLCTNEDPFQ